MVCLLIQSNCYAVNDGTWKTWAVDMGKVYVIAILESVVTSPVVESAITDKTKYVQNNNTMRSVSSLAPQAAAGLFTQKIGCKSERAHKMGILATTVSSITQLLNKGEPDVKGVLFVALCMPIAILLSLDAELKARNYQGFIPKSWCESELLNNKVVDTFFKVASLGAINGQASVKFELFNSKNTI